MEAINRKKLIDIENELLRLETHNDYTTIKKEKSERISNEICKLRELKNKLFFEDKLKQELNKTK